MREMRGKEDTPGTTAGQGYGELILKEECREHQGYPENRAEAVLKKDFWIQIQNQVKAILKEIVIQTCVENLVEAVLKKDFGIQIQNLVKAILKEIGIQTCVENLVEAILKEEIGIRRHGDNRAEIVLLKEEIGIRRHGDYRSEITILIEDFWIQRRRENRVEVAIPKKEIGIRRHGGNRVENMILIEDFRTMQKSISQDRKCRGVYLRGGSVKVDSTMLTMNLMVKRYVHQNRAFAVVQLILAYRFSY